MHAHEMLAQTCHRCTGACMIIAHIIDSLRSLLQLGEALPPGRYYCH